MRDIITLNIPVKEYLRKYLNQKYGPMHAVSKTSWLGMYIVDLLDKDYRRSKVNLNNESFYTVSVPLSIVKEVGFDICGMKLKNLSKMIHKIFLNDLYGYIEVSMGNNLKFYNEAHKTLNKQNVMRAIGQFLKFYSISEDEISVDSIYRNYYRDRKSDKIKAPENKETCQVA